MVALFIVEARIPCWCFKFSLLCPDYFAEPRVKEKNDFVPEITSHVKISRMEAAYLTWKESDFTVIPGARVVIYASQKCIVLHLLQEPPPNSEVIIYFLFLRRRRSCHHGKKFECRECQENYSETPGRLQGNAKGFSSSLPSPHFSSDSTFFRIIHRGFPSCFSHPPHWRWRADWQKWGYHQETPE